MRQDPVYRETLVRGELEPVYVDREGLMAYYRRADRNLMILANLKSEPEAVDIGCEYKILLDNLDPSGSHEQTQQLLQLQLQAWQGMILELAQ